MDGCCAGGILSGCSQDSRTIAFVSHGALYTIYASGKLLPRLTSHRIVVDRRPAFSPAGGRIAITTANAPACANLDSAQAIDSLELIDMIGRVHHRLVIDRQAARWRCEALGDAAWRPLPTDAG